MRTYDGIRGIVFDAIGYCFQNPGVVFKVGENIDFQLLQYQVRIEDVLFEIPGLCGTGIIGLQICHGG